VASEFDLIRRYFARPTPQTLLGPGDDCALIAPTPGRVLAVTTDMLVAGTHFFAETDPEALGWKCLAVNLSDLAAMGATPRWVTLAGSLPAADEAWLAAFARGLFAAAEEFTVDLVGGDTTRGPLTLSITAIGELPPEQALTRSGAQAGDSLWISGRPGRAALGLAHLQARLNLPPAVAVDCLEALHRPQPRVALGLALRGVASAAIDVSDGLLGDLGHLLERSQVGAEVRLADLPPRPAGVDPEIALDALLAGGDDYELLFTAGPAADPAITEISARLGLPLTRIGRIIDAPVGTLKVLDADNHLFEPARRGYDHFR
jgi:thiamine-monophosphate kinase